MAVVITDKKMGIYLGHCLGMGFWSMLDSAGQSCAATFPTEEEARAHVASWDQINDPARYTYVSLQPSDGDYATIADLKAAGLSNLLGNMEVEAMNYAVPTGTA